MTFESRFVRTTSLTLTVLTYLFLYLPIAVLLCFSFNSAGFPAPWEHFTFNWYHELLEADHLWGAFGNSLLVASLSTAISVMAGLLLIYYAAQGGRVGRFLGLFYGNLLIPETVLAVSLVAFFGLISLPLGLTTLILAHTVLGLGFVVPILYARFLELDKRLHEASFVLGATPFQTFMKVTFPLMAPTLLATMLLVFVISFDDFILAYFCAGSSAQTLPLYLLSMIRTGISPVVNALSTLLVALSCLFALLFFSLKTRLKIT